MTCTSMPNAPASRMTRITFDPPPTVLTRNRAEFKISLQPKAEAHLYISVYCEQEGQQAPRSVHYNDAYYYIT